MAPSREVEKLQRRWQENPLGLTFAPLAEAYRKEGMFADALELLDIGLSQHPSYVPAHIVKGRCFIDTRADPDAERAFLRVTDLDPENVIALKGLAEIAERSGRLEEAIQRLERLLEFDRSNEDAQQQLDQLRVRRQAAAPDQLETTAPEVAAVASEPSATFQSSDDGLAAVDPPRAEIVDGDRNDLEVAIFSPVELTANEITDFQEPADAESLETTEFQEPAHAESLEAASAEESLVTDREPPTTGDVVLETAAPVAPTGDPEPADVEVIGSAGPAESLAAAPVVLEEEPAAEPTELEPALVVTETMAEVFLRQGHRELALAVYSQLASRDPGNARIRAAIDRLEAEMGSTQSTILPAYAAVLTGGQSVRAYFEQLLASRRPGGPPKGGELSLGSVFGDERAAVAASSPVGPDPSFDEFYADTAEGPPIPPTNPPAADQPGADDLEGFTDWLRGLRR